MFILTLRYLFSHSYCSFALYLTIRGLGKLTGHMSIGFSSGDLV